MDKPPERIYLPDSAAMLAHVSPELQEVEGSWWVRESAEVTDGARELALEIAADLFTNQFGDEADHLNLYRGGDIYLGGWNKDAVVERVTKWLSRHCAPSGAEAMRAACVEKVMEMVADYEKQGEGSLEDDDVQAWFGGQAHAANEIITALVKLDVLKGESDAE